MSDYDSLTANLLHGMINPEIRDRETLESKIEELKESLGINDPGINWNRVKYNLFSLRCVYDE